MKKYLSASMFLTAVVMTFAVAGCGEQPGPPQKPAARKPQALAPDIQPPQKAEDQTAEKNVYIYDPKGRRDPFMSLVVVAKEKPLRKKGTNPVENFDVDEIKLSAIVWDNRQYYALITLPDGKSYTIKEGMTVGLYGGKVVDITKAAVIIRETIKDYRGQLKSKDTILKLRKEEEE